MVINDRHRVLRIADLQKMFRPVFQNHCQQHRLLLQRILPVARNLAQLVEKPLQRFARLVGPHQQLLGRGLLFDKPVGVFVDDVFVFGPHRQRIAPVVVVENLVHIGAAQFDQFLRTEKVRVGIQSPLGAEEQEVRPLAVHPARLGNHRTVIAGAVERPEPELMGRGKEERTQRPRMPLLRKQRPRRLAAKIKRFHRRQFR